MENSNIINIIVKSLTEKIIVILDLNKNSFIEDIKIEI